MEVVAIIAAVIFVASLALPSILHQRELARRTQCRDNLKSIGFGLDVYHDVYRFYPSAVTYNDAGVAYSGTGHRILITFRDYNYGHLTWLPDRLIPWYEQEHEAAVWALPFFVCPSTSSSNPVVNAYLGSNQHPVGNTFAITTYIYCKGITDAWCANSAEVPKDARGAFDLNFWIRQSDVTDGRTNTFFMGEGTAGGDWNICRGGGCNEAKETKWNAYAELPPQPWLVGQINTDKDVAAGYLAGSLFGCTRDPLNKNPVTDTMQDTSALNDCRGSLDGGPHSTSNFRSDHEGGAYFVFGDGRVDFINDNIGIDVYRQMSTIAGASEDSEIDNAEAVR